MFADVENAYCITANIGIIAANFFKINCWVLALKLYPKDETGKNDFLGFTIRKMHSKMHSK